MKIDTTVNMKTLVIVSLFFIIIIAFIVYFNNVAEKRRNCSINCGGESENCLDFCKVKGIKGWEYDSCLKQCYLDERSCYDQCK